MPEAINEKTIEITRVITTKEGTGSSETLGAILQETGMYTTEDGQVIEINTEGLKKGSKRAKSVALGVQGLTTEPKDVYIGRNTGRGVLTVGTGDRLVVQFNDRSLLRNPRVPSRGL